MRPHFTKFVKTTTGHNNSFTQLKNEVKKFGNSIKLANIKTQVMVIQYEVTKTIITPDLKGMVHVGDETVSYDEFYQDLEWFLSTSKTIILFDYTLNGFACEFHLKDIQQIKNLITNFKL